jgi:hypothetical protein
MHFRLENLEMNSHLLKDLDTRFDHQVVDGFGVLVTRPHDSLELQSRVDELLCGISENILEDGAVVNDI